MRRIITAAILLVALAMSAWAGFDEGMAAYERGDYATAAREFRPLAEQGQATAQSKLGSMYYHGHGVRQDYAQAARWFRKAAEQGYVLDQNNLGGMYDNGWGVTQDHTEAVRWYRKAAEQGHARSQFKLGFMYEKGRGVPQDYVQAHKWINLAASRAENGEVRDAAAKVRDIVAADMTSTQIAEAQRLARAWRPSQPTYVSRRVPEPEPPASAPRLAGGVPPQNRHGVAVIIGNKDYRTPDVPDVSFAHRDAKAIKRYVIGTLGFRERNVIDLRDATQTEIERAFGNERSHKGELWRLLREGKSDVPPRRCPVTRHPRYPTPR